MSIPSARVLAGTALLLLGACATNGAIRSATGDPAIGGTLTRGLFEPYQIEIVLYEKKYRGEWRTGTPTAEQIAGLSRQQKRFRGQVQAMPVAADGSKLDCYWQTQQLTGQGYCRSGRAEYPLILK